MIEFVVLIVIVTIATIAVFICIAFEKKRYNNGKCPKCKIILYRLDTDSGGSRGYFCYNCGYCTWVSYNCVDNIHKK